eukprot:m51a1_g5341 putative calcium calmodulin-dependent protein kinase type iv-like (496) ;mRNA; f:432663-435462
MIKVDRPITDFYKFDPEADALGRGAAGTVYRAVRLKYGVTCALKCVPKECKSAQQANSEVRCWTTLDHPHVVRLYEALDTPTQYCLAMELVKGGDLLDRITKDTSYCESRARELVTQLVGAVEHLHSLGVVHRDLKLENLLLSDESDSATLKMADFDLSCFDSDSAELLEYIGTPGYMAPEVIRCYDYDRALPYNKECDLWSVGVILYILLSGTPPFTMTEDPDDRRWMDEASAAKYSLPEDLWGSISEDAVDLVRKLLVIDPKKRLTARQTLDHPWMKRDLGRAPLPGTVAGLKKFNARRKLKGMLKGVLAAQRFQSKFKMLAKIAAASRQSELQLACPGAMSARTDSLAPPSPAAAVLSDSEGEAPAPASLAAPAAPRVASPREGEIAKEVADVELQPPPGLSGKELAQWEKRERKRIARAVRDMDKQLAKEQKARERAERREHDKAARVAKKGGKGQKGPEAQAAPEAPMTVEDIVALASGGGQLGGALNKL